MIKRDGRYLFEYTDGEQFKCYTCQHRNFRGLRKDVDYCSMKQKVLSSEPEQGCKSGWHRRYKVIH